jgi:hypothetical protein
MADFSICDGIILSSAVVVNCIALEGVLKSYIKLANYRRFIVSLLASGLFLCGLKMFFLALEKVVNMANLDFHSLKCIFQIPMLAKSFATSAFCQLSLTEQSPGLAETVIFSR